MRHIISASLASLVLAVTMPGSATAQARAPIVSDRSGTEQANLSLLERYHQAVWVEKRTGAVSDFMSTGFVSHASPGAPPGPDAVRAFLDQLFAAIPDVRSETLYNLVDGDRVVTAWTITGTHTGAALFGVPATGRTIRVSGIDVLRVESGRFAEHWFGLGQAMPLLMQQLQPAPAADGARTKP